MRENKGFTLLEIIVVIGIFGLISGITLANMGVLGSQSRLEAAANQIFDVMKKTRHNSISVKQLRGNLFPSYGVYFNRNVDGGRKIIVYADCVADDNGDGKLDQNDKFYYSQGNCAGGSDIVEEIYLPRGIEISAIRYNVPSVPPVNGTLNEVYMEFLRPEPTIWITFADKSTLLETGTLEMDIVDTSHSLQKKTFVFWSSGQFALK